MQKKYETISNIYFILFLIFCSALDTPGVLIFIPAAGSIISMYGFWLNSRRAEHIINSRIMRYNTNIIRRNQSEHQRINTTAA